jgi:hypothetical protein
MRPIRLKDYAQGIPMSSAIFSFLFVRPSNMMEPEKIG